MTTWLTLTVLACTPKPADSGEPPPAAEEVPLLEVEPTSVDFGDVEVVGDASLVRTITLSNPGTGTLVLQDLRLAGDCDAFSVELVDLLASVLDPGSSAEARVRFEPFTDHGWACDLVVVSDLLDPLRLLLTGEGLAPVLVAEGPDLGAPPVGCSVEGAIHVTNTGRVDLDLDSPTTDSAEVEILSQARVRLAPGEGRDVLLRYTPLEEDPEGRLVRLTSNDPWTPEVEVPLQAGATGCARTGLWEQPDDRPSDILFTLESTGYVNAFLPTIVEEFTVFEEALEELEADWRIGIVSSRDGCMYYYVDPDTSVTGTFPSDPLSVQGLAMAEAALNLTSAGECNEGFLRETATLDIVHIAAQDDASSEDWTTYLSRIQALKWDPEAVTFHAIAGDVPDGCAGADPAETFAEAVEATGGQLHSICADAWASDVAQLAEDTPLPQQRFPLDEPPVVATLAVRVDGAPAEGWTWDEAEGAVVFDDAHVPEAGTTVEITYHCLQSCE